MSVPSWGLAPGFGSLQRCSTFCNNGWRVLLAALLQAKATSAWLATYVLHWTFYDATDRRTVPGLPSLYPTAAKRRDERLALGFRPTKITRYSTVANRDSSRSTLRGSTGATRRREKDEARQTEVKGWWDSNNQSGMILQGGIRLEGPKCFGMRVTGDEHNK